MVEKYDGIPTVTSQQSTWSSEEDLRKVVQTILKRELLERKPGHKHNMFAVSNNPLKILKLKQFLSSIEKKHAEAVKRKGLVPPKGDVSDNKPAEDESDDEMK